DGGYRWIMEKVASIEYQGRRAILGDFLDITERKQMECKLLHAAEEWRTTFDSIKDFIFIVDKCFCNKVSN
ncbi:MAG: PAS domain S-box protein, partial [Candidatus Odinarchaeota archaeon]